MKNKNKIPVKRTKPNPYFKRIEKGTTELLIWNVPVELKQKFKGTCVIKEDTMREAIIRFMEEYSQ